MSDWPVWLQLVVCGSVVLGVLLLGLAGLLLTIGGLGRND